VKIGDGGLLTTTYRTAVLIQCGLTQGRSTLFVDTLTIRVWALPNDLLKCLVHKAVSRPNFPLVQLYIYALFTKLLGKVQDKSFSIVTGVVDKSP
jgi:hypothetical protein